MSAFLYCSEFFSKYFVIKYNLKYKKDKENKSKLTGHMKAKMTHEKAPVKLINKPNLGIT